LNVIIGSLSVSRTGPDKNQFVGGLKIGKQISGLPNVIEYKEGESHTSYEEHTIYNSYGYISSYEGTYSSYTDTYEEAYAEDHYAGEIWRSGNDLYAWGGSYACSYNSDYDIPAEWVKFDDARFIQSIPVLDETPEDREALVFDATLGMYVPDEVSCLVTVGAIAPSPTYTGLAWLDTS